MYEVLHVILEELHVMYSLYCMEVHGKIAQSQGNAQTEVRGGMKWN